jgi:hypothetical protein
VLPTGEYIRIERKHRKNKLVACLVWTVIVLSCLAKKRGWGRSGKIERESKTSQRKEGSTIRLSRRSQQYAIQVQILVHAVSLPV